MSTREHLRPDRHRILRFGHALADALDKVADAEPVFMSPAEKAEALRVLHAQEQRLTALRLRLMAAAADVADDSAARDVAAWMAHETREQRQPLTADLRLGEALDRRWRLLGSALGNGSVNLAQARAIVTSLEDLPEDLDADTRARAEEHLVTLAAHHRPRELTLLGRQILEVVAPDVAEAEEGRRLEAEERRARERTSLFAKRLGDGTTRVGMKLPDEVADRLLTYLDAYTSPRHHDALSDGQPAGVSAPGPGEADRIPLRRKRGQAFAALLEAIDPTRLPDHGGDATTVIVTVTLDALRAELAAAGVITSDDGAISAAQARRLACTARIVPAVLGSESQVLDLGRSTRLFTKAQRKALRLRDRHCRAEGCTVPAGWCDAHHRAPWSTGGATTLDNGVLLCNWHHHRIHDDRYLHERLPNGDIRFSRRT